MKKNMYIVVNDDLKIGKGKFAGQVSHCVGTFIYRGNYNKSDLEYFYKNNNIDFIRCSEDDMLRIESLNRFVAIRDMGLTQLVPNSLTCINLGFLTETEKNVFFESLNNDNVYVEKEKNNYKKNGKEFSRELAMYIVVNKDVTINKDDLAKEVAKSVALYYRNRDYSDDLMMEYMFAQKKIILKCSDSEMNEFKNRGIAITDGNNSGLIMCVNLGIFDKNLVDNDIKSLKLYSK